MRTRRAAAHRVALLGFAAFSLCLAVPTVRGEGRLARSTDGATVVLSYTETLGEIGLADAGPSVRVYGDGRLEVHYPRYMKRGGEWTAQLAPSEVDGLVAALADDGVLDFDVAAVRRAQRDAAAARRQAAALGGRPVTFEVTSDADTATIEVQLNSVHKKVAWHGLRADARTYPEVAQIQRLAAAERRLRALMERGDLRRRAEP